MAERLEIARLDTYRLQPLGDSGLLITLGDAMEERTHRLVAVATSLLEAHRRLIGFRECVPAYASVALYYDVYAVWNGLDLAERSSRSVYEIMRSRVDNLLGGQDFGQTIGEPGRTVRIPVCYGGDCGPDLEEVAERSRLTVREVIEIHSGAEYLVHMIGFAPGFPYLGGMSDAIATPRRSSPRMRIPAGSVGIGGGQTGVYSIATPGGWHIIGRTPLAMFRPADRVPSLLRAGDRVRFVPIGRERYEHWLQGHNEWEDADGEYDSQKGTFVCG